jgi:hypothetical protein
MEVATGIILMVVMMTATLVLATEVEYSFDKDCIQSIATVSCHYKGPGVLTSIHDHSTIRRLNLEQLTGLSVVMSGFADRVTVEYERSTFHEDMNICDHLHIAPRQTITATDQHGTVTRCVSTFCV